MPAPKIQLGPDVRTWPKELQDHYYAKWGEDEATVRRAVARGDWHLITDDERRSLLIAGRAASGSGKARNLEVQGWKPWLKTLGPRTFTKPFAPFHSEYWDWLWNTRTRLMQGERLTPAELVMLLIWFRGGGKSSHVEWGCIAEGARAPKGFIGYICETEALSLGHIQSIRRRLDSPQIIEYYPGLASPKLDRHGRQVAWRQDYLYTKSGWGIIPIGLEEGVRGGKLEDVRFTTLVFDDIDNRTDSPAAREKKLKRIAFEILPAGTMNADTMVWFPQNLIDEDSCLNQIYTGRVDILSERQVSGPHPAFQLLELVLDENATGRKYVIANAVPTWPEVDMNAAKKFLADSGRVAFLAEYQHDFEAAREGRVLRNYNDALMIIDEDDFERVVGPLSLLDSFNKYFGHDWSRTKSAYHANVGGKLAVTNQNCPLPGKLILFDLMSFEGGTQADDVGLRFLESISGQVPGQNIDWKRLIEISLSRQGLERFISDATRLIEARRNILADIIPPLIAPLLRERNYQRFAGSHDQNNDALQVYRRVYGLPFQPVNPGETGGLEWADHYMTIDKNTPHPFFDDVQVSDGTWEKGCPGFFVLVKRGKKKYPPSATPDALHDSDLCRYQFSNWRMRPAKLTESGAIEHGPMKMNDDFGQMLQMILFGNKITAAPLSYSEQVNTLIPPKYRRETLQADYSAAREMSVNFQEARAKAQIKSQWQQFDASGNLINDQQDY